MPSSKKVAALNRARSGPHRQQRLKTQNIEPVWIREDAPIGKYLVDGVAQELMLAGVIGTGSDGKSLIPLVRDKVWLAAAYAAMRARNYLVNNPKRRRLMKRLFEDLRYIEKRIERNSDLRRIDFVLYTWDARWRTRLPNQRDHHEDLLTTLEHTGNVIRDYLSTHSLKKARGGNHDPLTGQFIDDIFDLWCDDLDVGDLPRESLMFHRLVVAGWQDVGFPTNDKDGQSLEIRLGDRIRKRFHNGDITRAREDQQGITELIQDLTF